MFKGKLMASGQNAKTVKGDGEKFETAIMYLAPFTMAGAGNVCAMAVLAHCWEGCLNSAGRGAFNNVQAARVKKTRWYMNDRATFMATLVDDTERFVRYCGKRGVKPCIRPNGTSDIMWEKGHPVTRKGVRFSSIMEAFPEVQWYDYTKIYTRVDKALPSNYDLTLSYSEANAQYAEEIRKRVLAGVANAAVVFRTRAAVERELATSMTLDGDLTDLRFTDPKGGYVVALYAKGKAKRDVSGFVVD